MENKTREIEAMESEDPAAFSTFGFSKFASSVFPYYTNPNEPPCGN